MRDIKAREDQKTEKQEKYEEISRQYNDKKKLIDAQMAKEKKLREQKEEAEKLAEKQDELM